MIFNLAIHDWLGERRLITFVMAKTPVTEYVDHNRFAKVLAKFNGDLGCIDHGLRVIPVHMENWRFNHLRHV